MSDASEPAMCALMPQSASFSTAVAVAPGTSWVKLNAGQHVPLRCKYPDSMMPALAEAVRTKALGAADRIGLLSDSAALCRAGELKVDLYLALLAAFTSEDDATVWSMVLGQLLSLSKVLRGGDADAAAIGAELDVLARSMILPQLATVGWEERASDAHLTRKLRGELISSLPTFCSGDAAVVAEAERRFALFAGGDRDALPAEYQSSVYKLVLGCAASAEVLEQRFRQVLALYEQLPLNEEKKACLVGLGSAPTAALRDEALSLALSESVKLQDFFYVACAMHGASVAARDHTWAHFQKEFQRYVLKVGDAGSSLMDACISGACSGYADLNKADEILAFFAENKLPRSDRKIAQTVEAIRNNAMYLQTILKSPALAWLKTHNTQL